MLAIPLDVVAQGIDGRLQAGSGAGQHLEQGNEKAQALVQAGDDRLDALQIGDALAFGTVAQPRACLLLAPLLLGLKEEARMADQAFAGGAAGLLIVFEPAAQIAITRRRGGSMALR